MKKKKNEIKIPNNSKLKTKNKIEKNKIQNNRRRRNKFSKLILKNNDQNIVFNEIKINTQQVNKFTPWPNANDLNLVYKSIFETIKIEGVSEHNLKRIFIVNHNRAILLAYERILDWKQRCINANNLPFPFVEHLICIESLITILIEEFQLLHTSSVSLTQDSLLYNLYCNY